MSVAVKVTGAPMWDGLTDEVSRSAVGVGWTLSGVFPSLGP